MVSACNKVSLGYKASLLALASTTKSTCTKLFKCPSLNQKLISVYSVYAHKYYSEVNCTVIHLTVSNIIIINAKVYNS